MLVSLEVRADFNLLLISAWCFQAAPTLPLCISDCSRRALLESARGMHRPVFSACLREGRAVAGAAWGLRGVRLLLPLVPGAEPFLFSPSLYSPPATRAARISSRYVLAVFECVFSGCASSFGHAWASPLPFRQSFESLLFCPAHLSARESKTRLPFVFSRMQYN